MKRCVFPALAAVLTFAMATPAAADWNYTRWGMTPEQVVRASGGTARLRNVTPNPGQSYIVKAVGDVRSGGLSFAAEFRFQDNRLRVVTLLLTSGSCYSVRDALTERYGEPRRGYITTWRSRRDNLEATLETFGGQCVVSYRPSSQDGSGL